MTIVSFGDLAQSYLLKSQIGRLKGDSVRITQELSSGKLSDIGAAQSGDLSRLSATTRSRSLTEGYQSAAREAASHASASQAAFGMISGTIEDLVSPLLTASQLNVPDQILLTATDARSRLDLVLSTLNSSVGGRSLFSGQDIRGSAVADADTILTALRAELTGATSPEDAMTRISAWFDDPAGFATVAYQGDVPLSNIAVSATDSVWMGTTANDPAIRSMLKGLTAAALVMDPGGALPTLNQASFARVAAEALITGQQDMTYLAGRVGISESRIEAAQSRNAADLLTLEMAESDMVSSDPYRLATELEAVQTNLETVYAITARISRLTLADFLR